MLLMFLLIVVHYCYCCCGVAVAGAQSCPVLWESSPNMKNQALRDADQKDGRIRNLLTYLMKDIAGGWAFCDMLDKFTTQRLRRDRGGGKHPCMLHTTCNQLNMSLFDTSNNVVVNCRRPSLQRESPAQHHKSPCTSPATLLLLPPPRRYSSRTQSSSSSQLRLLSMASRMLF